MSPRSTTPVACRISREEYDCIEAVNWSTLKYAVQSGLCYQHHLTNPPEDTDAMKLGRATHTAVFEPDRLLHEYVMWSGGRRAGGEWEAFKAMHAGRTILKPEEYDTAIAIRDAVHSHKAAKKLLTAKGQAECTLRWVDKQTGLACKARLDWLTSRALVDLKTTRNIESRAFGRHAGEMLYHCQFAFARMGLEASGKKPKVHIIAVENEAPHDVAVYTLTDDDLWAGEDQVRQALDRVAECRRTKRYPGRYPEALALELPGWLFPKDENEFDLADLGLVPAKAGMG